jgi:hypothetical protein
MIGGVLFSQFNHDFGIIVAKLGYIHFLIEDYWKNLFESDEPGTQKGKEAASRGGKLRVIFCFLE